MQNIDLCFGKYISNINKRYQVPKVSFVLFLLKFIVGTNLKHSTMGVIIFSLETIKSFRFFYIL